MRVVLPVPQASPKLSFLAELRTTMAASFTGNGISPTSVLTILSALFFLINISPSRCDPDPLQDICVADLSSKVTVNGFPCKPASNVTSDDFFFSSLTQAGNFSGNPFGFGAVLGTVSTFPGLNTLGLSMNRADFAPGGIVVPHTHPRSSELVLVLKGTVLVGFVSTSNVYYSKVVQPMEIFVIPRGVVHFQQNVGKGTATLVAVFNSQDGGIAAIPQGLFGAKPAIPSTLLAKAFQIEEKVVDEIKSKFGGN